MARERRETKGNNGEGDLSGGSDDMDVRMFDCRAAGGGGKYSERREADRVSGDQGGRWFGWSCRREEGYKLVALAERQRRWWL